MLERYLSWIESESNVFKQHGCVLEITRSLTEADIKSVRADFEFNCFICRITFWDSGTGHVEVINMDSEETLLISP